MKKAILSLILFTCFFRSGDSQTLLSQFDWDAGSDERTPTFGPPASGSGCRTGCTALVSPAPCNYQVGTHAIPVGNGTPQGIAPSTMPAPNCGCLFGTCRQNIFLSIPNSFGGYVNNYFNRNSLTFQIDFRKVNSETGARFFHKDNTWFGLNAASIKITANYEYDNGGGGSGGQRQFAAYPPTWTVPGPGILNDGNWRTYTFTYDPPTGTGRIIIGAPENYTETDVWIPGRTLYWAGPGANPMIIGADADGNGTVSTIFDNASITDPSIVLPITLLKLNGRKEKMGVNLSWTTGTEITNDHFIISRSTNGEDWSLITNVDAIGNSMTEQEYSYFDANPRKGINYYKLYQVDYNGHTTGYPPVEVVFNDDGSGFMSLYPNPTEKGNAVGIKYQSQEEASILKAYILNVAGQLVLEQEYLLNSGINDISLDVSALPPGVYFARLTENGVSHTVRFMVMEPQE